MGGLDYPIHKTGFLNEDIVAKNLQQWDEIKQLKHF